MKRIVDATYKDGKLTLDEPLDLPEGARIRLAIVPADDASPEQARELANAVYTELSSRDLADIQQVALMSHHMADSGMIDRAE